MTHYRYDMIGADILYGIKAHPQDQMHTLGFHVVKSEPFPIADCWIFRVDDDIKEVPGYLHPVSDTFKFSDEYDATEELQHEPRRPPIYKEDGTLTDYGDYVKNGKRWLHK